MQLQRIVSDCTSTWVTNNDHTLGLYHSGFASILYIQCVILTCINVLIEIYSINLIFNCHYHQMAKTCNNYIAKDEKNDTIINSEKTCAIKFRVEKNNENLY